VLVGSRLRLDHKVAVLEALQLYGSTRLHFVDCLCVAHARREAFPHAVYSYDQDLESFPGIRRLEPRFESTMKMALAQVSATQCECP
jgi:predicted nucleic-acid-binding protein